MLYEKQKLRGRFISSGSSQTSALPEEMLLFSRIGRINEPFEMSEIYAEYFF